MSHKAHPLVDPFTVRISERGSMTTVALTGELDAATLPELEAALPEVPETGALVLDLRRLAFMDSSGIRLVMNLDIRSRAQGWTLAIVSAPGPVQRVMDICRIPERVRTVPDPADLD